MDLKTKPYKAWAAAIGGTLTALMAATATAADVLADDKLTAGELGLVATAVATLVGTVFAVWRTPNPPQNPPN